MKISQLRYNEDVDRFHLDGDFLSCGDPLHVLIVNGLTGKTEWADTRIELDGSDRWYLVGLSGYDLCGLFASRG